MHVITVRSLAQEQGGLYKGGETASVAVKSS